VHQNFSKRSKKVEINIGINAQGREKSANAVKRLLAETYTLYLKTHGYHWNVEGPHFQQLHIQFMEQYTEMWNAVDELAERVRALGHYAPSSYSEMSAISTMAEETERPDWQQMVRNLASGHEQVANTARDVLRIAEEVGDEATADVVTPRLTLHEKTAWMLRATAN
jgi:starvation-inducible DNA-binding protein